MIDGNLTLKGVSKPISFNTNVVVKDGVATIKSEKKISTDVTLVLTLLLLPAMVLLKMR